MTAVIRFDQGQLFGSLLLVAIPGLDKIPAFLEQHRNMSYHILSFLLFFLNIVQQNLSFRSWSTSLAEPN